MVIPRIADIDLFHVSERATRQKRRAARYKPYRASGATRAGRARGSTAGREKLVTGGVAPPLWYTYHGANRSYPVANFSPVKQVTISDPWYKVKKSIFY